MIMQHVYLDKYDWTIYVYYQDSVGEINDILTEFKMMSPPVHTYNKVKKFLKTKGYNSGCTYSDFEARQTFVVVCVQESNQEFINTYNHEKAHIVEHIAEYYNISQEQEEYYELSGLLGEELFDLAKFYMCDINSDQ